MQAGGDLRADVLDLLELLLARVGDRLEAGEAVAAELGGGALGGHRDREADQRLAQPDAAAALDRGDHVVGRDLADAVELEQGLPVERVEVRGPVELAGLVEALDPLLADRVDVRGGAARPVDQAADRLGRAGDVGAVELAAVALLREVLPAARALRRRDDLLLGPGALGGVEHAGHERDHVPGAADEHRVADPHVAGADDLLVGERRARDGRAADEDGLEHGDRRHLADLAHVPDDVGQQRRLLLGGVLERERAARGARAGAGGGVGGPVGQPQDGAVEVVVELVAALLDLADHLLRVLRVAGVAHVGRVEPERLQRGLQVVLDLALRAEVEGEEPQPAALDGLRVLGAHGAGGGVAGVDQRLVGVRLVVGREGRAQHHELPADLGGGRRPELRRDAVGDRLDERRHVLPGGAVAARDRPREPPALVDEREREPVELGHHDHGLAGEALEERHHLLGLGGLLEREHRAAVADRRVQDARRPHHLERVRVRREVRVLLHEGAQLVLQPVVLGVRHERLAAVVRVAQLDHAGGQLVDPLLRAHPAEANHRRGPDPGTERSQVVWNPADRGTRMGNRTRTGRWAGRACV